MKTFSQFIQEAKRAYNVDIESERGEFERYSNSDELIRKARKSPIRKLTPNEVSNLRNSDAPDIKPGAKGRRKVRRLAREYGKDAERVRKQIKSGTDQAVIVKKTNDGHELIGGNTRAMTRRALNKPIHALVIP